VYQWFWRLGPGDQTHHSWTVQPPEPEPLKQFWSGLPPELEKVDAVFERPSDRRIFIFSGKYNTRRAFDGRLYKIFFPW